MCIRDRKQITTLRMLVLVASTRRDSRSGTPRYQPTTMANTMSSTMAANGLPDIDFMAWRRKSRVSHINARNATVASTFNGVTRRQCKVEHQRLQQAEHRPG